MTPAETAAAAIQRDQMIQSGEKVLVAFSGGADSTALAVLLRQLGHDVVLGHVDHGMRAESGADSLHCAAVAKRLGCIFLSRKVRVEPPTQAQARRVRYQALEEMAGASGATKVATGHTLDDQAETVRLRLERGGYGMGIPPVRGKIVRPLLDLRRAETEQVCREEGIQYLMDPSNRNLKYRRVAVRAQLAGGSEEQIHELAGIARAARAEAAGVARQVDALWARIVRSSNDQTRIQRQGLRHAGRPVAHQLIRRAASELGTELTGRVVADILSKVLVVTGARLALPDGLSVWAERDQIVVGRYEEHRVLPERALAVPGKTRLPEWGREFVIETVPMSAGSMASGDRSVELVDAAVAGAELTLRQWRPGDRFHPLGAPGSRKLQDFFVDEGVPRMDRSKVPLVVSGDRIVWIVGHRLDDRFKIGLPTTSVLRLATSPAVREQVA